MPRKVALLAALACSLAFAAPASADVVASRDSDVVARALTDPLGGAYVGAQFPEGAVPPAGNPAGVGNTGLAGFPVSGGTFAALSSGNVEYLTGAAEGYDNFGSPAGHGSEADIDDVVTLNVTINVPEGASCLRVDFRFFSNEAKGSEDFSDAFVAELGESDFSVDSETGELAAPSNFAGTAQGPISVTSDEFESDRNTGTPFSGATPMMTAAAQVTPGTNQVYFSIFDRDDEIVDSAVILDAMRLDGAACVRGATVNDGSAPSVGLSSPANGSTVTGAPTYAGTRGDDIGDGTLVTVRTTSPTGQTSVVTTDGDGSDWSVAGPALAPGTYTAVASQSDRYGNTGESAPVSFTVAAAPPPPPPVDEGPPPPVTGKAVNVAVVKGKVRIRRPGGKFVLLDDASQIPTGSTIDTRNGTVALTSTGAGGKLQKANFFDGLFKVTQTRGKKPLTNLTLNEKLAKCPKKKASKKAKSSAKKKRKRRLWGDGKGNFRTSGRRSAATVSGTRWLVEDTCKGTLTRVSRGKVKVRDFRKKKTVTVKAGKRYLAK